MPYSLTIFKPALPSGRPPGNCAAMLNARVANSGSFAIAPPPVITMAAENADDIINTIIHGGGSIELTTERIIALAQNADAPGKDKRYVSFADRLGL